MRTYVLITLNTIEYTRILLKKTVLNVKILNVSMQYKVTVQIAEQLSRQMYSEHCQTFKMERVAKRAMLEWRCAARILSGQGGGFAKLGHFNKLFIKNPQWNILKSFILDTLKTTFWMTDLTQRSTQLGSFFPKKQGRSTLSPVILRQWVWLHMRQYPWISLNILENAWANFFDNASALNVHDHLTCLIGFWRCLGFYLRASL